MYSRERYGAKDMAPWVSKRTPKLGWFVRACVLCLGSRRYVLYTALNFTLNLPSKFYRPVFGLSMSSYETASKSLCFVSRTTISILSF